jgi:hypothetical protein
MPKAIDKEIISFGCDEHEKNMNVIANEVHDKLECEKFEINEL